MQNFSALPIILCNLLFASSFLNGAVIPEQRIMVWEGNVGVPGGIPDRTAIHLTLNPGVSAAQISDAINSCPPGKVVKLEEGVYELGANQIRIYNRDSWTLRGAGMGKTILKSNNGNNVIAVGSAPWLAQWPSTKEIMSGATKGSTSITVNGGMGGINLNELIWIEQPNTGSVFGYGSGGSGTATPFPGVHRMNDVSAVLGCRAYVTGISGSMITFTPPLPFDFDGSPRVVGYAGIDGPSFAGIEDLTVSGASGGGNGINLQGVYRFWLKNVEVTNYEKVGIVCWWSVNIELRGCYIHDPASFNWSRGYGIELNSVNHCLVEDNILYRNQGGIFVQGSTVGNVIAYNCAFRLYPVYPSGVQWQLASFQMNHASHSKYNLWEGNYGNYFQADFYYGGSSSGTLYRNFVTGFDPETTQNTICISIDSRNWDWNVVGNVLGLQNTPSEAFTLQKPGVIVNWAMPAGVIPWVYGATNTDNFGYSARRIFRLGYPYSGQNSYSGTANPPAVGAQYGYLDLSMKPGESHETLIHGNWDAANATQTWKSTIQDRTLRDSYYMSAKPTWFGNLTWPPYDPSNPPTNVVNALSRIPAGFRLINNRNATNDSGDSTPPTVPTELVASPTGSDQIALKWGKASDNVGVTSYQITRSQGAGATSFLQIASTSGAEFIDFGVQGGVVYNYRVAAVDAGGNQSAFSNIAVVAFNMGADTIAPSVPAGFAVLAVGAKQANLRWNAAIDNIGVDSYILERSEDLNSQVYVEVTVRGAVNYIDSELQPATIYNYRVKALDAQGNASAPSSIVSIKTASVNNRGLMAAFGFDESSGSNAFDSSGNQNNGTTIGTSKMAQGKHGGALMFNGVSDSVIVNNSASLNFPRGMTLEAWVYPTANQSSWRTILHKEKDAYYLHTSNPDGSMLPAGGAIFDSNEKYVSSASPIPVNAWSHIAVTFDGAFLRNFVNGVQTGSRSVIGSIQVNEKPLRIGGNTYPDQFFKGMIDDVRLYDRALSASEILTDMNLAVGAIAPASPSELRILPASGK